MAADSAVTGALSGIFALLGVLGGAVLAPVMNRRLDDSRNLESARVAWRLLRDDVRDALVEVDVRLTRGEWPTAALRKDWSSVWYSSRGILIQYLDDDTYKSVAEGFARMDRLESAVNTGRSDKERDLGDSDRLFLNEVKERLERVAATLKPEPLGQPRRVARALTRQQRARPRE